MTLDQLEALLNEATRALEGYLAGIDIAQRTPGKGAVDLAHAKDEGRRAASHLRSSRYHVGEARALEK